MVRLERAKVLRSFTVEMAAFHWSFPNWPVHIIIGITVHCCMGSHVPAMH